MSLVPMYINAFIISVAEIVILVAVLSAVYTVSQPIYWTVVAASAAHALASFLLKKDLVKAKAQLEKEGVSNVTNS